MKVNQYAGAVIRLSGIVQGVGFRPFVYRNARRLDLKGTVQNTDMGVLIAIDGERANIERFFTEIRDHPPVNGPVSFPFLPISQPARSVLRRYSIPGTGDTGILLPTAPTAVLDLR